MKKEHAATRRRFLKTAAAGIAAAGVRAGAAAPGTRPPLCIFSKHLQWTNWKEAGAVAAELGFDGVDLTVRAGGHVLPERVEADLPRAVADIKAGGSTVTMITTAISDAGTPHAENILRAASAAGIRHYRWGGLRYSYDRDVAAQLEELKPRVAALAALSEKHGVCGIYHTHSGLTQVGASIWDAWLLVKDLDPRWIAVNYDVGHATVEGGLGGWVNTAHATRRHMRGVALKDFRWDRNAKGQWAPDWCAAGQGMVNFKRFFEILKAANFSGPVQVHYEYEGLGGADAGRAKLGIAREELLQIFKRDVTYYKEQMAAAGW